MNDLKGSQLASAKGGQFTPAETGFFEQLVYSGQCQHFFT